MRPLFVALGYSLDRFQTPRELTDADKRYLDEIEAPPNLHHVRGLHRFCFGLPAAARLWIPVGPRARLSWFELSGPDGLARTGNRQGA